MKKRDRVVWKEWARAAGRDKEYSNALFDLVADARGGLRGALFVSLFFTIVSVPLSVPPLCAVAYWTWFFEVRDLDWGLEVAGAYIATVAGISLVVGLLLGATLSWRTSMKVLCHELEGLMGTFFPLMALPVMLVAGPIALRQEENEEIRWRLIFGVLVLVVCDCVWGWRGVTLSLGVLAIAYLAESLESLLDLDGWSGSGCLLFLAGAGSLCYVWVWRLDSTVICFAVVAVLLAAGWQQALEQRGDGSLGGQVAFGVMVGVLSFVGLLCVAALTFAFLELPNLEHVAFGLAIVTSVLLVAFTGGSNSDEGAAALVCLCGLVLALLPIYVWGWADGLTFLCLLTVGLCLTLSVLFAILVHYCLRDDWKDHREDGWMEVIRFFSPGCRPNGVDLEEAVRQFNVPLWNSVLGKIKTGVKSDRDIVDDFFDESWQRALVAQHIGMRRGVRSVRVLDCYGAKLPSYIAAGNRVLLKPRKGRLFFCSRCLLRVVRLRVWPEHHLWMYGCHGCLGGERAVKYSGEVIAVLDRNMTEKFERHNGDIRVNALAIESLFDFDRVMVGRVDDAQLEVFLVQVRNDCDKTRRRRARRVACELTATSNVSENLKRALAKTFRVVTAKQATTPAKRLVA